MSDTTVTKIDSTHSPKGQLGQKYLATGKSMSMRLWDEGPNSDKPLQTTRDYEVIGYVLEGSAELELEGQTIRLNAGDSWVVPKGATHSYRVKDHFKAVEASHPPAEIHGRDQ